MGRGMEGSRRRAAESTNHHLLPWTGVSVPHFHFAAEEAPCSKDVPAAVGLASGKAAWSLLWALLTAARLLVLSGVREPVNDGAGVPCSMHMQTTLPFPSPLPSRGCTSGRRDNCCVQVPECRSITVLVRQDTPDGLPTRLCPSLRLPSSEFSRLPVQWRVPSADDQPSSLPPDGSQRGKLR